MYITWKYDLFPYELCGKVISAMKDKSYSVEGYNGMKFIAKRRIFDNDRGLLIKEMLENAGVAYREDLKKLEDKHRKYIALRLANMNGIK